MKKRLLVLFPLAAASCFFNSSAKEEEFNMICKLSKIDDIKDVFPKSVREVEEITAFAKRAIAAQVNAIINTDEKNWMSIGDALDRIVDLYSLAAPMEAMVYVHPDANIRQAAQKAVVELHQILVDKVSMNKELFDAFKNYAVNIAPKENLSEERKYFIAETLKDFEKSGLNLPEKDIAQVKQLLKDTADLSQQFEVNISADNKTFKVKKDELKGLPENFIKNLKKDGDMYVLGVDNPTAIAVLQDCSVAETRKKMYKAYNTRAYPANIEVLHQIINKRDQLAQLLGYPDYAHVSLDSLMAKNPETVYKFLNDLLAKALPKANKEFAQWLSELPESVVLAEGNKVNAWDIEYLKSRYKEKHLVGENELRQYFPMENTVSKLLAIYEKFFNLKFNIVPAKGMWHDSVQLIEVVQDGKVMGYILLDLYPRENKYTHACHISIINSVKRFGTDCPALSIVIANFPKSTKEEPSLLKLRDVETFFHEFGHAIHALLGRTEQFTFSGTSVKRDFVEMPSQMLENWLQDKEILKMVSSHYQTGKPLSDDLIEKILKLDHFDSGYFITRQIGLSLLSLNFYGKGQNKNLDQICLEVDKITAPQVKKDPEAHFWASFGHLPGYNAGYYGYLWSDVFSKDLFEHIKSEGLLSPEAGKRYAQAILAPGGSKDPEQMLFEYLQRKPNQEAYLRVMGLS